MSPGDETCSEDEDENKENIQTETCSLIELQALKKELQERNAQRDDLVLKLKVGNFNAEYKNLLTGTVSA